MDRIVKDATERLFPNDPGVAGHIMELIEEYRPGIERRYASFVERAELAVEPNGLSLNESDAILIASAEALREADTPTIDTLFRFLDDECDGAFSSALIRGLHPHDYRVLAPGVGSWDALQRLADEYRWVAELSLSSCSMRARWFELYSAKVNPYRAFFVGNAQDALSGGNAEGDRVVLNYREPAATLELLAVLLEQLSRGAQIVRLQPPIDPSSFGERTADEGETAEANTSPNTEDTAAERAAWLVRLFQRALELTNPYALTWLADPPAAPDGALHPSQWLMERGELTQRLVQAVLHADTRDLQEWLTREVQQYISTEGATPLQFAAWWAVQVPRTDGAGAIDVTDSTTRPRTLFDIVTDPHLPDRQRARTYLTMQAIVGALHGVPAFDLYDVLAASPDSEINYDRLLNDLHDAETRTAMVFEGMKALLIARASHRAFAPRAPMRILASDPTLLVLIRGDAHGDRSPAERQASGADRDVGAETGELAVQSTAVAESESYTAAESTRVLCMHNVSGDPAIFVARRRDVGWPAAGVFVDLISGDLVYPTVEGETYSFELDAYEVLWLAL